MSYIEKAIYHYLKSILTTGIEVLFSKEYITYAFSFLFVSLSSSVSFFLSRWYKNNFLFSSLYPLLIYGELTLALNYIIYGLFFSHYQRKYWGLPFIASLVSGFYVFYRFPNFSAYFIAICFFGWSLLAVSLSFSFSRNFWGHKILGSILFFGKKSDEGTILFAPLVFFISLINVALVGYTGIHDFPSFELLWQSIFNLYFPHFLSLITIGSACLAASLIPVIIFKWGSKDDVFYTILAFFYVFSSFAIWRFVYHSIQGIVPIRSLWGLFTAFFFLLFTLSGFGRKVKELDDPHATKTSPSQYKEKPPQTNQWLFLKILNWIDSKGLILCFLGVIMGLHISYLQFMEPRGLFIQYLGFTRYQLILFRDNFLVMYTEFLFLFLLLSYHYSSNFKNYASPNLYRVEILPSFEEFRKQLEKIDKGEQTWQGLIFYFFKEALKKKVKLPGKKTLLSSASKLKELTKHLFGKNEKE